MNIRLSFVLIVLISSTVWGQTDTLKNIPQTKTTAHDYYMVPGPLPIQYYYDFSTTWDIGTTKSGGTGGNPTKYDNWYSAYKFSLSGLPAGYPIKKVTMTVLVTQCDYYSSTFYVKIGQLDNATSLTDAQSLINAISNASSISTSLYQDTVTVDITNLVGQRQLSDQYLLLGTLSTDGGNNSHAKISITVNVEYYLPITITADNNFTTPSNTDGKIIVNGGSPVNAPVNVPNLIIGNNVSLQAVSPQTDNLGYQRVWNTSGVTQSISYWQKIAKNVSTQMGNNIQLVHTVTSDDWNASYIANLMKVYSVTFQNNFIGAGNSGVITVNNTQVNSPSLNNMVVEQNPVTATADYQTVNGISYYFDHWNDGSISATKTFNPTSNDTYTAYFTGTPSKANFNFGFDQVVGQPIKMHWTDNVNPNVTYQIWRTYKGDPVGPTEIATVQRGVQTYTDYDYTFTGTYTDKLLYYDVREYYSVEGTTSDPAWEAVYGSGGGITPKASVSPDSIMSGEIKDYSLACYPNPFNPSTTINFQLPKDGFVALKVYDIVGNEVKILVNGYRTAGNYSVNFDASNLSSGIYFYQIKTNNYFAVKKMMLLK